MKILLVEDEEMLNGITAKYLRAENMTVDTCFNGQQAIDYVNTSSYDVIVMDIMMPVMDGITATKIIRSLKHPDAETIPIIAMTANAFREDKEKCLAAGMNAHLAKPIKIENIKRILYEYCV